MANSSKENPPSSPTNPHNTSNNDASDQTPPPPPPPSPPPPPPPPPMEAIQESNTAPPATPPPPAIQSGGGGSSGEGSNPKKKKRGKKPGDVVDDQQGSGQKKKRGEMDAPKREPVCCVCGKKFASWKAVFGHFRAHSGREWRGAFPPPTGDALAWLPPSLPPEESLASTLLRLARETLEKMTTEDSSGAGSGSRVVFDFDLNKEPPLEEPAGEDAGSAAAGGGEDSGLDLNLVPVGEKKDVEMAEDKGEGDA